jgi:Haem-binding domain
MRKLVRILKWVVMVLAVIFLGAQFIRPERTNPAIDQSQTIEAHVQVPTDVSSILARSCNDCHSNKTVWPWYSNITPVSWWLTDHVNHGRKDLNMSEWGKLPRDRQERKLREICDEVTGGMMPLPSYLPAHPSARLSEQDKKALCDWTDAERERLATISK